MKFLNKSNVSLILAIGVVGLTTVGGFYLYNSQPAIDKRRFDLQKKQEEKTETQNTGEQEEKKEEADNPEGQTSNKEVTPPEQGDQTDRYLQDVGLQALLDKSDYGISVKLYGPDGVYVVEKKVANAWVGVKSNIVIQNKVAVDLGEKMLVSDLEQERTYRIYKIVNGQKIGPKEVLISRNLVDRGGGVTNFPGAL